MKKLALAAAAILVALTTANASMSDFWLLSRSGKWETIGGRFNRGVDAGAPYCAMRTHWQDGSELFVAYIRNGNEDLHVQMTKPNWRFAPWQENKDVPLEIWFDHDAYGSVVGKAVMDPDKRAFVKFPIASGSEANTFLEQFASSDWLWIKWGSGDEHAWNADMTGSRDTSNAFMSCVNDLKQSFPLTSPVDKSVHPDHQAEMSDAPNWLKKPEHRRH